jgi:hypothetical protein
MLFLMAAAVGYVVYIYRKEEGLSRPRRIALGLLRALLYLLIILVLFEPVLGLRMSMKVRKTILVFLDTSESMSIRDARRTEADLQEAAMALGEVPLGESARVLSEETRKKVASVSRIGLAKTVLDHPEIDVFEALGEDHDLVYLLFGEKLRPLSGDEDEVAESLKEVQATEKETRLGDSLRQGLDLYAGRAEAAVVLTDGASNAGLDPAEVSAELGERNVPVHAIGFGLPDPPDLCVTDLFCADAAFKKDKVPVGVGIDSRGYRNRPVEIRLTLDDREIDRKKVVLRGGAELQTFEFTADEVGMFRLGAVVSELPGEVSPDNNAAAKTIRVLDDKIQVLYIEGKPRWEYRYLRAVLLRDRRLDVKFLMAEGDMELARRSDLYLARFPEATKEAFRFDLVILGDVPAFFFNRDEMDRMEEVVREWGGSFLMIAGSLHAPMSYVETPVAKMLPVKLRSGGWVPVTDAVHPVPTADGREEPFIALHESESATKALWSLVRPLYQVPIVDSPKPGATVLLTLPGLSRAGEPYPLVAWHRYGTGKSLFVGTDQLWRLRFKRGDTYHARFWSKAVQFLTLSRLLGENKPIRLQTDQKEYRTGERVRILANVLDEDFEPLAEPTYTVRIRHLEGELDPVKLSLGAVPDSPGLYQGYSKLGLEGSYRLEALQKDREFANSVDFEVRTVELEKLEPALQAERLKDCCEASGGRYFTIAELPELAEAIKTKERRVLVTREEELWDHPLVLLLLLALAGVEWFVRRRSDLL